MKCLAKDRNNNSCRNYYQVGSRFCKNHQYMNDYTEAMLEQTRLCSGCKKMYYLEPGINQCSTCHSRGTANREKMRATAVVVPCGKPGCTHSKYADNAYCGLHQICLFVDECTNAGTRPCAKYLRGCRVQLSSDYLNRSCAECLEKERVRDHAVRSAVVSDVVDGVKQCSVCCKSNPVDCYVGANGQETKTCMACRDEFARQNEKRDKEYVRELDRKNSKKPERVAVKNEWNENNYEKVVLKTLNYRQRQIEGNYDEYMARNAHNAAKWRENNPEKVAENNENKKKSIPASFYMYQKRAEEYRLPFEFTLDVFESLVTQPCYYCAIIQEKGFNGIDRKNQKEGYIGENCVSCCKVCNFIKGSLDNITFVQRVEHILTIQKRISGNLYPDIFPNHTSCHYNDYQVRAVKLGYDFQMTCEEYANIITRNCYICDKPASNMHTNGIDRFDNNIGYVSENIRPCCFECNVMKLDMLFDDFINKLTIIHSCNKNMGEIDIGEKTIHRIAKNKNKKTPNEMREEAQKRKQKQRDDMLQKYSDEEYKAQHIRLLSDKRKG